ncbi:MAG: hypothetical protein IKE59_06460 [Erysipelotrichaceae bacterium]|nr:hypothetical protein [Erysipelotrichaceae bacterium]
MKKKLIIILSAVAALILAAVIRFHRYNNRHIPIIRFVSDDSYYYVQIDQIGAPEFPFGETKCEALLYRLDKRLGKVEIVLKNDGKNADVENFDVIWEKELVRIRVNAEEMEDQEYTLPIK